MSRWGWKSFAIATGLLFYLPTLFPVGPGGVSEDRDWVSIAYGTISMLGLVGFAWRLRIGWRWAWRVFLIVNVVGFLILTPLGLYFGIPALPDEPWLWWGLLGMFGVSTAFWAIGTYALFRYAFREDALWRPGPAESH